VAQRGGAGPAPTEPTLAHVSVEQVVTAALRGVERKRPIVIPGAVMKFGMTLVRLTPLPLLRLANRFSRKPA